MDKTTTPRPFSVTGLFWSQRGEVACEKHIPFPGSDTWHFDHWVAMEIDHVEAWKAEFGSLPTCESCGTEAITPAY